MAAVRRGDGRMQRIGMGWQEPIERPPSPAAGILSSIGWLRDARPCAERIHIASKGMVSRIGSLTYLVRDYDEAIAWFTQALGFTLLEDTPLGGGKRWVRVAPPGGAGTALLLARAATPAQVETIGRQGGGRVFLFLETDDFARDHRGMRARGVRFLEEPRRESYGTVAVFEDLHGNRWDLIEPRREP